MGRLKGKIGFALMELLVVIAVIAILAAILFPIFTAAKKRAYQTRCLSNLRQLATAFRDYAADYGGIYPRITRIPEYGGVLDSKDWCGMIWVGQMDCTQGSLWPYTRNRDIYVCPVDRPLKIRGGTIMLSYSANNVLHGRNVDAEARRPSKVMLMIHEAHSTINDGMFVWLRPDGTLHDDDMPDNVHYDGSTAAYCDGHAAWRPYKELMRQFSSCEWALTTTVK